MATRKSQQTKTPEVVSSIEDTMNLDTAASKGALATEKTVLPVGLKGFAITKYNPTAIAEVLRENFGGETLDRFALSHVKVPSGESLAWTIQTLDGPKPSEFVDGVIIAHQLQRAYWETPFGAGAPNSPPDCSSTDSMIGIGDPGGSCAACPFAEFGSATNDDGTQGDGQACRLVRVVFLLREQGLVPTVLPLPPGSLKAMRAYLVLLSENGLSHSSVVTRFALKQDRSKKGITFAKADPKIKVKLTEDERAAWITPLKQVFAGLTNTLDVRNFENVT